MSCPRTGRGRPAEGDLLNPDHADLRFGPTVVATCNGRVVRSADTALVIVVETTAAGGTL